MQSPLSKFKQPFTWTLFTTIVIVLASACSSSQTRKNPSSTSQFDQKPEAVILYAYIHYPGLPEPTKTPKDRYCPFLPSLIVWGDGFAFLDEDIRNKYSSVFIGHLDSATLQTLFDILNSDHFFTNWQIPIPDPSGTALKIGAQLKGRPATEYIIGNLGPSVYVQLIKTIRPALKPITENSTVDKRADAILKENENCNKYMVTGN